MKSSFFSCGKVWLVLFFVVLGCASLLSFNKFDADKIVDSSRFKGAVFNKDVAKISALEDKVGAYLMEEHSLPIVAVSFGFDRAGSAYEPKAGVVLMTENSILDGAGEFSRHNVRDFMKERGIKLGVSADKDRFNFSLSFISKHKDDAIKVIRAVLYEPHLNLPELQILREQIEVMRSQRQEKPQYLLEKLVKDNFYDGHPYSNDDLASKEKLDDISVGDIRSFMKDSFAKDNLKVGMAGDISKVEAVDFLEKVFADLNDEAKGKDLPSFNPDFDKPKVSDNADNSSQSFAVIYANGIDRLNDDFYPLYIANYILGGSGLNSLLNQAVREEKGLTYGIYSYLSNMDAINLFGIGFSATPDNMDEIYDITNSVYKKFYEEGVSLEQLNLAKSALLSSFNLRFASLLSIAYQLEQMQVQNLGIDFLKTRQQQVDNVSLDEVNRAIKKYLPKSLESGSFVRVFEINGKK